MYGYHVRYLSLRLRFHGQGQSCAHPTTNPHRPPHLPHSSPKNTDRSEAHVPNPPYTLTPIREGWGLFLFFHQLVLNNASKGFYIKTNETKIKADLFYHSSTQTQKIHLRSIYPAHALKG